MVGRLFGINCVSGSGVKVLLRLQVRVSDEDLSDIPPGLDWAAIVAVECVGDLEFQVDQVDLSVPETSALDLLLDFFFSLLQLSIGAESRSRCPIPEYGEHFEFQLNKGCQVVVRLCSKEMALKEAVVPLSLLLQTLWEQIESIRLRISTLNPALDTGCLKIDYLGRSISQSLR